MKEDLNIFENIELPQKEFQMEDYLIRLYLKSTSI